jgi:hypothetical protein
VLFLLTSKDLLLDEEMSVNGKCGDLMVWIGRRKYWTNWGGGKEFEIEKMRQRTERRIPILLDLGIQVRGINLEIGDDIKIVDEPER